MTIFNALRASRKHCGGGIVNALPEAEDTTRTYLKAALEKHLKRAERQVRKLEQVFRAFGERAVGMTCDVPRSQLDTGDEFAAKFQASPDKTSEQ